MKASNFFVLRMKLYSFLFKSCLFTSVSLFWNMIKIKWWTVCSCSYLSCWEDFAEWNYSRGLQERTGWEGHLLVSHSSKLLKLSLIESFLIAPKYYAMVNWLIASSASRALSNLKLHFFFVVCGIHYSIIYFELPILVLFGYVSLGCVFNFFSFFPLLGCPRGLGHTIN